MCTASCTITTTTTTTATTSANINTINILILHAASCHGSTCTIVAVDTLYSARLPSHGKFVHGPCFALSPPLPTNSFLLRRGQETEVYERSKETRAGEEPKVETREREREMEKMTRIFISSVLMQRARPCTYRSLILLYLSSAPGAHKGSLLPSASPAALGSSVLEWVRMAIRFGVPFVHFPSQGWQQLLKESRSSNLFNTPANPFPVSFWCFCFVGVQCCLLFTLSRRIQVQSVPRGVSSGKKGYLHFPPQNILLPLSRWDEEKTHKTHAATSQWHPLTPLWWILGQHLTPSRKTRKV